MATGENSGEVRRIVAQISNLLYRGLPIRQPSVLTGAPPVGYGQPTRSRRYSRLEICATLVSAAARWGKTRPTIALNRLVELRIEN
jgi:hypothetical protein